MFRSIIYALSALAAIAAFSVCGAIVASPMVSHVVDYPVSAASKAVAAAFGAGFLAVILLATSRRAYAVSFALVAFLFAGPALAAETTVDLKPLVDLAIEFAVAALTALVPFAAGWIALKANKTLGLKIDAQQRAVIEQGLARAIGFGVEQAKKRLQNGPVVDVKREAVAQAISYAQAFIPGALAHFGITPDKLAQMIEARLSVESDHAEATA